jgi:hypothetical protein
MESSSCEIKRYWQPTYPSEEDRGSGGIRNFSAVKSRRPLLVDRGLGGPG